MVADSSDIIFEVINKHIRMDGIGAIGRIGEPEILPDHNSIGVASIIKCFVINLTHPISDHIKIHVLVIPDSCVVFAGTIAQ